MVCTQGKIDRWLFTGNADARFTEEAPNDCTDNLGSLGAPEFFTATRTSPRGGTTERSTR